MPSPLGKGDHAVVDEVHAPSAAGEIIISDLFILQPHPSELRELRSATFPKGEGYKTSA